MHHPSGLVRNKIDVVVNQLSDNVNLSNLKLSSRSIVWIAFVAVSGCSQYLLTKTDTPDVVVVSPTGREYLNVDGMVNWNQPSIPEEDSISRTQRKCKGVWVNGKWIKTQQGWEYISGYCKKKFK